jgi:ribosomal protein S18 acetylase RimI-like enzyme
MAITIRDYREDDWEAVCRVHDRARPLEVGAVMPPEEAAPMAEVADEEGFFAGRTFVACEGERVVGFITIGREEIQWLYVDPDFHRRGIGRALVEHVRPIVGENVYVLAGEANEAAMRFYRRLGFEVSARFPGEVQGRPATCARLTLPGSRAAERPPRPTRQALELAGFGERNPGRAVRGQDGVWVWK